MSTAEESRRTVQYVDETSIHYTATGPEDGPTWVYIHGWGCRRTDFDGVAGFLPAGHRVITVDLAGHGDSHSARGDWSMAAFAADVAAVADAESLSATTVVGHSLGGAVALELARLRPHVVRRVIGLDAYHYLGLYPAVTQTAAQAMTRTFEDDFPAAVRGLIAMGSVPDTDPAFSETIFEKMSSIGPQVGVAALEGMLRWDMDDALAAIEQPVTTLAVRGLLDSAATRRYGERIEFVAHDLGSHHFLVESPAETAALLLSTRGDE